MKGSAEAVKKWSRVQPILSALTGTDPTGADGGINPYERWSNKRRERDACDNEVEDGDDQQSVGGREPGATQPDSELGIDERDEKKAGAESRELGAALTAKGCADVDATEQGEAGVRLPDNVTHTHDRAARRQDGGADLDAGNEECGVIGNVHNPAGGAPGPLQEMLDPETGAVVHGRVRHKKARKAPTQPVVYEGDPEQPSEQAADEQGGQLQGIAAKVLMKILYGARMARLDLLRAVCHLARYITRWDSACDRRLHRLVAYIYWTMDYKLVGWVGDGPPQLQPKLYADADFAGCVATQRSTSGAYLCIRGPHTLFPIAAGSRRQGCVSKSTPEAEIVSMDGAIRSMGIP